MKTKKWERILVKYFLTLFLSFLMFLPIDIITYGDIVTGHPKRYFIINLFIISISVVLYTIALNVFNKRFWSKRIILRIFMEILCSVIVTNILLYLSQILFLSQMNLIDFFQEIFASKNRPFLFISMLQGWFIVLILEVLYLYNKRKESELEKEKFKYFQLKNQLNPHFLFNSLSVSISLIKKNQDKAVEYMKKLSLVYRYVLINTESDFVLLEEELNFIKKYIDILQIRYDEGLNVTYNVDNKILNMQIVPLSLQLLVENAVKHNATYSYNPLNIHIYSEGKQIIVANNIIKKTTIIDSIGVGLKNLNQKYNILFSKDIQIINDSKNFIVKIPLA